MPPDGQVLSLVELSRARQALATASTLDDVRAIRDTAEAARVYAKAAVMSLEVQNHAVEIKLLAERRAGEMLAAANLNGGDRRSESHDARVKLDSIGVTASQSSRWQKLAAIPEAEFASHVEAVKERGGELTTAGALKLAKQIAAQEATPLPTPSDLGSGAVVIDSLDDAGTKFSTIYADPPWQYGNQSTRAATDNHYSTMTMSELAAMHVAELAADNAHLWLWATTSFLPEALWLMGEWGFTYKSNAVWVKPQMGIGNYLRVSHEHLLLGVRGSLTTAANDQMSWLQIGRTKHSAKPEEFRLMVERLSPGPYIELFGRKPVEGWTVFGNQVEARLFPA